MDRYLTVEECAAELRVERATVIKLLKKRIIVGIEITQGKWRILAPAPKLREWLLDPPIERVPFISPREAAKVLGMALSNMRWHINTGKVNPRRIEGGPHFKVLDIKELRRFAATREKRTGPGRLVYSPLIVKWVKSHLAQDLAATAEAIQGMLDEAVKIAEPERSQKIVEIWALIDKLDEVLKNCSNSTSPHRS